MPFHELNKFQNRGKYTTKMEITQDYTQKKSKQKKRGGGVYWYLWVLSPFNFFLGGYLSFENINKRLTLMQ